MLLNYVETVFLCFFSIITVFIIFIGTPHREANFEDRAKNFVAVTQKQIETARLLADNGGCNNKHIIENIHSFARQVLFFV